MAPPLDPLSLPANHLAIRPRGWVGRTSALGLWLLSLTPVTAILLCDAGLTYTLYLLREEVFGGPFVGMSRQALLKSDSIWFRLTLILSAFVVWCGCLYLAVGSRRFWSRNPCLKPVSINRVLVTTAVYVVSLGMLLTQAPAFMEYGESWRISRMESRLRQIGRSLFDEWPTAIGAHPLLGTVGPHPNKPNQVFLLSRRDSFGFVEDVGGVVEKDAAGNTIMIELNSVRMFDRINVAIVLRSPDVIPDEALLRKYRTRWSRCWRIAPDLYFAR